MSLEDELILAVQDIQSDLEQTETQIYLHGCSSSNLPRGFTSLDEIVNQCVDLPLSNKYRISVSQKDPLCYIYTSGTTGQQDYLLTENSSFISQTWRNFTFTCMYQQIKYIITYFLLAWL